MFLHVKMDAVTYYTAIVLAGLFIGWVIATSFDEWVAKCKRLRVLTKHGYKPKIIFVSKYSGKVVYGYEREYIYGDEDIHIYKIPSDVVDGMSAKKLDEFLNELYEFAEVGEAKS